MRKMNQYPKNFIYKKVQEKTLISPLTYLKELKKKKKSLKNK